MEILAKRVHYDIYRSVRFETYEGINESVFIFDPIIMIWKPTV